MKKLTLIVLFFCLTACAGVPENIKPVTGFDLNKYSGQWYEIARLDHSFERGLEQVTANYTINDDGTVKVENRGFSTINNEWENAIGRAKFKGDADIGHLKVSFFGPFFGNYIIFELDKENYQYAFVTGGKNFLWLKENGYKTDELIFVKQK